ncbi:MAG: transposase [Candidatus Vecturithrix sp.]|jgi:hypothetical protein|nr:transposase [Candidatus Vecturithrix sp.]
MLDRLMTVIGMGFVVAATILTEIHGLNGFQNSAQLCAYAGIVPVICRESHPDVMVIQSLSYENVYKKDKGFYREYEHNWLTCA